MYRIFTFLYPLFVRLAAPWNPKARRWIDGRKELMENVKATFQSETRAIVWFHCASLGEFEQGRPLIEGLRRQQPNVCVLLTFFSPSGLEVSRGYAGADHIFYLPMDSPRNARRFLDAVGPALAVFVKYEFWHYYLSELHNRKVPTLLVSAVFRPDQPFFRWYGAFWRRMLHAYTAIFVQDKASLRLLSGLAPSVFLSGDTRFDRVLELAPTLPATAPHSRPESTLAQPFPPDSPLAPLFALVVAFAAGGPTIVAGSTWDEDEKELAHFVRTHPNIHFIIAPHELSKEHVHTILHAFPESVPLSTWSPGLHARCLVIDNIGMLSRLYQLGTITYVGGGFGGDGVHNVLEPAVWGKPVVFGPIYDKYREASELIEAGGALTADNTLSLEQCFRRLLDDPAVRTAAGHAARAYVERQAGATKKILEYIAAERLLEVPPRYAVSN